MTRSYDVSQLTAAELELTGASFALIASGSPRTCRSSRRCGQSTPSLPDVPVTSSPAQASATTAPTVPARRPHHATGGVLRLVSATPGMRIVRHLRGVAIAGPARPSTTKS
jgi:hypothetical protein